MSADEFQSLFWTLVVNPNCAFSSPPEKIFVDMPYGWRFKYVLASKEPHRPESNQIGSNRIELYRMESNRIDSHESNRSESNRMESNR